MYQRPQALARGQHGARRTAAGCGTETAVSVRTRSGRRGGEQPADGRAPVVADQVHRAADPLDQGGDVADEQRQPVVAAAARAGRRGE